MPEAIPDAVCIKSWAAVFLDQEGGAQKGFGEFVDKGLIPAGTSRRLSAFGKMAIGCGLSAAGAGNTDLVFCSRFGDLDIAYRLLRDLSTGGLLSPAAFSNSVHNAVPGVMDMVRKSKIGHTAIAGGTQSLSAGIAECWAKLALNPEQDVTLVLADGVIPDDLQTLSPEDADGIALAMTLSTEQSGVLNGRLSLVTDAPDGIYDEPESRVLATAMIEVLSGKAASSVGVEWRSRGLSWSLRGAPHAAC